MNTRQTPTLGFALLLLVIPIGCGDDALPPADPTASTTTDSADSDTTDGTPTLVTTGGQVDGSSDGGPAPMCGDGVVDDGEDCDAGGESADCNVDCTAAACGDGVVNATAGEECDEGGSTESCDDDCTPAECGDGVVNRAAGEICDDGGRSDLCNADCTSALCGDGVTNAAAGEECDDGGFSAGCDDDCTFAECGDNHLNPNAGEMCDEGLDSPTCDDDCTPAMCGDGVLNEAAGEECDEMIQTMTCNADCTAIICGDGVVTAFAGEECDDGGESATCDADCTLAVCGDGNINATAGEICDDGNVHTDDDCPACEPAFCGDGYVQAVVEECDDGNMVDDDFCSNSCVYVNTGLSCKEIRDLAPGSPSAIYPIDPDGGGPNPPQLVYCDMDTDEGGWTLVGSTRTETLEDMASAYYDDLQTINPVAAHQGVWDGMRPLAVPNADIRFTCMADPDASVFEVDLSFYDIIWYDEITTGTEAMCCFSEGNGAGDDQPTPARRDNISGAFLPSGDQWSAGYLEGEDSCSSPTDFTVDFDDRGMDSNQSDGTDWGEDDSARKCGVSGLGNGAWHIWVREL